MILLLCAYNGRLYVPKIDTNDLTIDVFDYCQRFTSRQNCFAKVNTIKVSCISRGAKLALEEIPKPLHFSVVGNSITGLNLLYFIVEYNNSVNNQSRLTAYAFQINSSHSLNQCFVHNSDNFPKESNSSLKLQVTEGPRLFWAADNGIHIFSCNSSASENHGIQVIQIPCTGRLKDILFCNVVGTPVEKIKTLFLLIIQISTEDSDHLSEICVVALNEDGNSCLFEKDAYLLPRDDFLPHQYSSQVTSVNVELLHSNRKLLYNGRKEKPLAGISWAQNTTIVSTKQKQFLVFIGGCLRYCCQIPFCDVWKIIKFTTHSPYQVIFMLQSKKGACAVKKEHDRKLKCSQIWEDVADVVAGNVTGKGSSQLLLLSNVDSDTWFQSCILTDLHKKIFPICQTRTQELPNSKQNIICGLRERLIFGQAALVETEERIREEQAVIDNILRNLTSASCGGTDMKHVTVNTVLVDLLSHHSNKKLPPSQAVPLNVYPGSALKIVAQWKAVTQNHWIIGWTMKNTCDCLVSDLQIYSTIEEQPIDFVSKSYWHHSNGLPSQPDITCKKWMEKNLLEQNNLVSFVIAIPLPVMLHSTVAVTGVILWNVQSVNSSSEKIIQQIVFHHTLNIKEIVERRQQDFEELSFVQQLMSLRVEQQCRTLSIISLHTDLTRVEDMLESLIAVKPIPNTEHSSAQVMAFFDLNSPLYGVNFAIHHKCLTEVEMEIFFREIKQLLLCIHWLYDALPEDIMILIIGSKTSDTTWCRQLFLSSIKDEAELTSSLVSQQCSAKPVLIQQTDSVTDIHKRFKEECQSVAQDSVPQTCEHYRRIRNLLSKKELYTDKCFSVLRPL